MGEWSKKIGEFGEKVVTDLLEEIGWGDAQKNLSIPCVNHAKHGRANSAQGTHGIDLFFSYPSRLVDRTLDHLVISVKYSSIPYPNPAISKFKEHFYDLTQALECFRKSSLRSAAGKQFSGIQSARNIGVLFWLTNDKHNTDIVSNLYNLRKLEEFPFDAVFIVDDFRASFLYDAVSYVKAKYKDSMVEFFHPSTGKNINPATRESASSVLPVEYVNSPILPFRVTAHDNKKSLVLASSNSIGVNHLRRMLGLAQALSQDFASNTVLLYPEFDSLTDDNLIKEAKAGFEDKKFTESVSVCSYRSDFRGIDQ